MTFYRFFIFITGFHPPSSHCLRLVSLAHLVHLVSQRTRYRHPATNLYLIVRWMNLSRLFTFYFVHSGRHSKSQQPTFVVSRVGGQPAASSQKQQRWRLWSTCQRGETGYLKWGNTKLMMPCVCRISPTLFDGARRLCRHLQAVAATVTAWSHVPTPFVNHHLNNYCSNHLTHHLSVFNMARIQAELIANLTPVPVALLLLPASRPEENCD